MAAAGLQQLVLATEDAAVAAAAAVVSGEGCALHPSYVTYMLNRTMNDVVARYVTNSLTCASVVEKGECAGVFNKQL
jgi:hypothetical protein